MGAPPPDRPQPQQAGRASFGELLRGYRLAAGLPRHFGKPWVCRYWRNCVPATCRPCRQRAARGAEAFAVAWAEGRALPLEEALALAVDAPGG